MPRIHGSNCACCVMDPGTSPRMTLGGMAHWVPALRSRSGWDDKGATADGVVLGANHNQRHAGGGRHPRQASAVLLVAAGSEQAAGRRLLTVAVDPGLRRDDGRREMGSRLSSRASPLGRPGTHRSAGRVLTARWILGTSPTMTFRGRSGSLLSARAPAGMTIEKNAAHEWGPRFLFLKARRLLSSRCGAGSGSRCRCV